MPRLQWVLLAIVAMAGAEAGLTQERQAPIALQRSGGFVAGGKVIAQPRGPGPAPFL